MCVVMVMLNSLGFRSPVEGTETKLLPAKPKAVPWPRSRA